MKAEDKSKLLADLRAYLDHPRCQVETLYEGHPSVLIHRAYDALLDAADERERVSEGMVERLWAFVHSVAAEDPMARAATVRRDAIDLLDDRAALTAALAEGGE